MRKLVCLILIFIMVFSMWGNAFALSKDTDSMTEYNIVLEKVSGLMRLFSQYQAEFGLEGVDLENVYLGTGIPVYCETENGLSKSENKYYPIIDKEGSVVATVLGIKEGEDVIISVMTDLNEEINTQYKERPICIIDDGESIITTEGERYCFEKDSMNEKLSFEKVYIKGESKIDSSNIKKAANLTTVLDVNVYKQPSGSNICWACSAVCTGNYKAGREKRTVNDIVEKYAGGNENASKSFTVVKAVLSDEYGLYSTIKLSELAYSTVATNIMNDNPIITATLHQSGFHAFVVCGYYSDATQKYVVMMDPARSTLRTEEVIGPTVSYSTSAGRYATQSYMLL
ncbi:MAG: hypothetical protein HFE73_01370 [Firmicutes bacterium]|nr:hypothetical protein [Bacillota bacterium]